MTVQNAAAVAASPKSSVVTVTSAAGSQPVQASAQPVAASASANESPRNFALKEREKVRKLFLVAVASVIVLLIACFSLWYYHYSHFNMFGKPIDIYAEEVDFNGREIPDFDSLKSYLRRFKNLKVANLGTYPIEAEASIAFRQAFPDTELIYDTVVNIDGIHYRTDLETLDLSGCGIRDTKAFIEKLAYLPNLKTVIFGEQVIPETEKNILINAYPEIEFEVLGTYEIYGKQVLENVETLDLRDVKLDASLFDQLALLPQLREVDLHNQPLTVPDRIALTNEFPNVSFGWTVKYDGEEYDSSITEFDLTGKKLQEEDLEELKETIEQFPLLEKVILCDCGLSNNRLAQFQKEIGDRVRVVWRVYIGSQWSLRTDAVAFSVLIVNYKHIRMTSENLEVLKYCPDLLALDLGHQALTDISPIAEYLPDLRLLIIADNRVYDLSPLEKLKHLHYLEIFVNRVTDLSPLAKLRELVDVNISYNSIVDISPLLNSPMMQRVWLESTYVGYNGLQQLRETYPDAKIVNVGSGSVDQGWRWGNPRYEQMMDMWFHDYYGDEFQKYDDLAVELGLRDDE
ncbi:MAG: hypothetical protein MJ065_04320 [Oscillospiraceae bacterium]|nr:hypothetical protein [Oscillospiraceae bacterium]